ncbi:hypothetical protein [Enterococcus sp. AZ050]|uniref:hypothetical protein n=1 Tax=Enterococcus sp. AZ050 TaxID=2774696 RepID=UPI003F1F83A6
MADKTIKELADSLGVSKDRVKYQLRKLPSKFTYKKGNITYLKKEAVSMIIEILSVDKQVYLPRDLPANFLLHEIETKNNYIY